MNSKDKRSNTNERNFSRNDSTQFWGTY